MHCSREEQGVMRRESASSLDDARTLRVTFAFPSLTFSRLLLQKMSEEARWGGLTPRLEGGDEGDE